MPQINNYKSRNNLSKETKIGNTVVFSTDAVLAYPVRAISAIAADPPAVLAAIFANVNVVSVSLWPEGNEFQFPVSVTQLSPHLPIYVLSNFRFNR
jgi:hypothetical protein